MRIARYEPWNLVHKMHHDLDRIFASGPDRGTEEPVADWLPAVDIAEEQQRFVVRADIPGVSPEMIEITMDDGVLSIRGERRNETEDGDEQYRTPQQRRAGNRNTETGQGDAAKNCGRNGLIDTAVAGKAQICACHVCRLLSAPGSMNSGFARASRIPV